MIESDRVKEGMMDTSFGGRGTPEIRFLFQIAFILFTYNHYQETLIIQLTLYQGMSIVNEQY